MIACHSSTEAARLTTNNTTDETGLTTRQTAAYTTGRSAQHHQPSQSKDHVDRRDRKTITTFSDRHGRT